MPETFQPIHPRKLQTMLASCKSRPERSRATLTFLCNCTGAERGYLLLRQANGLELAADSGQGAPMPDLLAEAERVWASEFDHPPDDSRTRTVDLSLRRKPDVPEDSALWRSPLGVAFATRVLGIYVRTRWVPVGIAVLETKSSLSQLRHAYIEAICQAFIQAGEIPGASEEGSVSP